MRTRHNKVLTTQGVVVKATDGDTTTTHNSMIPKILSPSAFKTDNSSSNNSSNSSNIKTDSNNSSTGNSDSYLSNGNSDHLAWPSYSKDFINNVVVSDVKITEVDPSMVEDNLFSMVEGGGHVISNNELTTIILEPQNMEVVVHDYSEEQHPELPKLSLQGLDKNGFIDEMNSAEYSTISLPSIQLSNDSLSNNNGIPLSNGSSNNNGPNGSNNNGSNGQVPIHSKENFPVADGPSFSLAPPTEVPRDSFSDVNCQVITIPKCSSSGLPKNTRVHPPRAVNGAIRPFNQGLSRIKISSINPLIVSPQLGGPSPPVPCKGLNVKVVKKRPTNSLNIVNGEARRHVLKLSAGPSLGPNSSLQSACLSQKS